MATLQERVLSDEQRPGTVDACERVVNEEVASKTGISGLAIKAGFKTVVAFKKTIIHEACDALIDEFVEKLEAYYAQHLTKPEEDLRVAMVRDAEMLADTLLKVTDARAERNKNKLLVGAYHKLRPMGQKQVVQAMPRIAAMLVERGA